MCILVLPLLEIVFKREPHFFMVCLFPAYKVLNIISHLTAPIKIYIKKNCRHRMVALLLFTNPCFLFYTPIPK